MSSGSSLIVGVDYGTTYSGVAFVESDGTDLSDVQTIAEWDHIDGATNDHLVKAPSRISYGPGSAVSWGYNIKPGAIAYSWTKLLLDDQAAATEFDDPQLRSILDSGLLRLPPGKTAQEVTTDYLRELYKHTMSFLERKYSAGILRTMPIKFWFSMPAIWSDEAQYATRDAAKAAGFASRNGDQIFMVKEPAAAAIASLNQFIAKGPNKLVQRDQGVMVVDCGGGTVDLTSFVVRKEYPKLELEQTCVSMGGKCGSTAIDRNFYQLLADRFGSQFSRLPPKQRGLGSELMRKWESAKKNFGHDNNRTTLIYLPGLSCTNSAWYDEDDEEILITSDDMKKLFDPIMDQIIALVDQQVNATMEESSIPISTIVLAGGFGESRYLYNRLKAWCPSTINLVSPPNSWSAIVRGAALRGLEGPIFVKEKCSNNYGLAVSHVFQAGIDKEDKSHMNNFSGTKMASGYVDWLYTKGEDIKLNSRKTSPGYHFAYTSGDTMSKTMTILKSNMAIAPEREDHFSVEKLCEVNCSWTQADLDKFESTFSSLLSYKKVWKVVFSLDSMTGDDIGLLHFQFTANGRVFGTTDVRWKRS